MVRLAKNTHVLLCVLLLTGGMAFGMWYQSNEAGAYRLSSTSTPSDTFSEFIKARQTHEGRTIGTAVATAVAESLQKNATVSTSYLTTAAAASLTPTPDTAKSAFCTNVEDEIKGKISATSLSANGPDCTSGSRTRDYVYTVYEYERVFFVKVTVTVTETVTSFNKAACTEETRTTTTTSRLTFSIPKTDYKPREIPNDSQIGGNKVCNITVPVQVGDTVTWNNMREECKACQKPSVTASPTTTIAPTSVPEA